jgi:hypothetical protein
MLTKNVQQLFNYIGSVNKLSVEQQKNLVLAKQNEGVFNNFPGIFAGMMKRLNEGKKLTASQITWLYYASEAQSKIRQKIPRENLEAFM